MSETEELSESAKEIIEKNRLKAIALRKSRLVTHPYNKGDVVTIDQSTIKIGLTKYKDTGGGFLLEEVENTGEEKETAPLKVDLPPVIQGEEPDCLKCGKKFGASWLFDTFEVKCCDECKDPEEHKLIPKTEAKSVYLLKDCDLDKRDPPLKFITRKNPHNVRWGDMKLYLEMQVEQRAMEIWGSKENLEEEHERRNEKKEVTKAKKYHKQLKELRMSMRSSLYDRTTTASHTHEFGPESYNEESDEYTRKCKTCPYSETFEKI